MSTKFEYLLNSNSIHLQNAAYALADAMASTHIMKEVFIRTKDMEYEEWVNEIRLLISRVDREIYIQCGITVFNIGLCNAYNPQAILSFNKGVFDDIPPYVFVCAREFGKTFNKLLKELFINIPLVSKRSDLATLISSEKVSEITGICKETIELIFNVIGLKGSDIARIYCPYSTIPNLL